MSRGKIKVSAVALWLLCATFFAVGCGGNGDTNPYTAVPPKPQLQVETPSVCSLGSKVVWEECQNATEYDVYINGEYDGTTSDCFYSVEFDGDVKVTVKAKNGDYYSALSNATTVYDNSDITEDETWKLSCDYYEDKEITVPSSIRLIELHSDTPTVIHTAICIENRTTDLILSLKNVTLKYRQSEQSSVIRTKDAALNRTKHDWSLILDVSGESGIDARLDDNSPKAQPSTNSGETGSNGNNGLTGIRVTSIAVIGGGILTVTGGNGQDGARGADATLLSTKSYGHGGNGGNGGSAVECKHLLVDMLDGGACALSEGKAGKGGAHGSDPKGITSNVTHFTHTEADCNGKDGSDGKSVISLLYNLGGELIRQ